MQTVLGSAKIYQFPTSSRRANTARQAEAQAIAAQAPRIEFGAGWYHDAAIEDAAPKPAPANVTPFARH